MPTKKRRTPPSEPETPKDVTPTLEDLTLKIARYQQAADDAEQKRREERDLLRASSDDYNKGYADGMRDAIASMPKYVLQFPSYPSTPVYPINLPQMPWKCPICGGPGGCHHMGDYPYTHPGHNVICKGANQQ